MKVAIPVFFGVKYNYLKYGPIVELHSIRSYPPFGNLTKFMSKYFPTLTQAPAVNNLPIVTLFFVDTSTANFMMCPTYDNIS
jgi:hypothetical protein